MKTIALIINIFLAILGALGSVSPGRLFLLAREFQNMTAILVAAGLRMLLGTALLSSAPDSRMPRTLRFSGVLSLLTGIASPFIGVGGFRRILKWWHELGPSFIRVWAGSILAFGLFMIWALSSSHEKEGKSAGQ